MKRSFRAYVLGLVLDPTLGSAQPAHVRAILVNQLSKNISTILFASTAIAGLLVWGFRDLFPVPQLFTWFFCILSLNCARYLHARMGSLLRLELPSSRRSSLTLTAFAAVSGMVWGAAGIFFFPIESLIHQVFLTFTIGGLIAGAAVSYASWPPAFLAFAIPSLLPLAIQFVRQGSESAFVMGAMLIVYGIALSSFARKFSSSVIVSTELQLEKDCLLDDLSKAKERYDLCLEGSHDGIWDWDFEQKEIHASFAFGEIMEIPTTGEPFPDSEFIQHIYIDDRRNFQSAIDAHINGELPFLSCEFRVSGPDGSMRWVLARGLALRSAEGQIYRIAGSVTDISERVAFEARMAETQKLEALGQLTSGVAHEFNNLLQVIVFGLDSLRRYLPNAGTHTQKLNGAIQAVKKGGELTRGLLSYTGKTLVNPQVTKIDSLVFETVGLLRPMLGETIEIETVAPIDLWDTLIDRSQMQSAIMNLAINARDAMLGNGKLTIEIDNFSVNTNVVPNVSQVGSENVRPGDYVRVTVTDTGTGMTPDVIAHAFEPFFTTKEVGQGTGLGLSQVYGFVARQSEGYVAIASLPGEGTTIFLYIPRCRKAASTAMQGEVNRIGDRSGEGTILVVEDDALVRDATLRMVEEVGYKSFSAENGEEALAWLEGEEHVDVVLTDVIMPGDLNGVALSMEIKQRFAGMPVILMTGYAQSELEQQGVAGDNTPILQKPITADELTTAIEQSLESRSDN